MPRECALCTLNSYDQFGIYVNPAGYYWDLVEGGGGAILDPVDDPGGIRSVWTFGGSGEQAAAAGSYATTITVTNGAPQHLSIALDTATGRDHDTAAASWGTISNVRLVPYVGAVAKPPLALTWSRSAFDPDAGTTIAVDAGGADIGLATHASGASPRATQVEGIWGAGAVLPGRDQVGQAYTSYQLTFDYDLRSHDTRGTEQQPQAALPPATTPISDPLSMLLLLGLVTLRFPR